MTNRIALTLIVLIGLFLAADYVYFGAEWAVFLGRKLIELIEWIAFWR